MTLMPVTRMRGLGRLVDEQRRLGVDRGGVGGADRAALVDRLADDVHDPAERLRADGHADLRAGVGDLLAAGEAVGRVHRDRADGALAEMLGDLEDEAVAVIVGLERREDLRQLAVEADVDDGADHLADAADDCWCVRGLRRLGVLWRVFAVGGHSRLPSCSPAKAGPVDVRRRAGRCRSPVRSLA